MADSRRGPAALLKVADSASAQSDQSSAAPHSATFTTASAGATLVCGQAIYATGRAWLNHLTLMTRRPIRPGRYTLVLTRRQRHRWVRTRRQITIPWA